MHVRSLEWTRWGFDNAVLLEHREVAGHGRSTGFSKEFNLPSAYLRGYNEFGFGG